MIGYPTTPRTSRISTTTPTRTTHQYSLIQFPTAVQVVQLLALATPGPIIDPTEMAPPGVVIGEAALGTPPTGDVLTEETMVPPVMFLAPKVCGDVATRDRFAGTERSPEPMFTVLGEAPAEG
jgi:hypothetical protein